MLDVPGARLNESHERRSRAKRFGTEGGRHGIRLATAAASRPRQAAVRVSVIAVLPFVIRPGQSLATGGRPDQSPPERADHILPGFWTRLT